MKEAWFCSSSNLEEMVMWAGLLDQKCATWMCFLSSPFAISEASLSLYPLLQALSSSLLPLLVCHSSGCFTAALSRCNQLLHEEEFKHLVFVHFTCGSFLSAISSWQQQQQQQWIYATIIQGQGHTHPNRIPSPRKHLSTQSAQDWDPTWERISQVQVLTILVTATTAQLTPFQAAAIRGSAATIQDQAPTQRARNSPKTLLLATALRGAWRTERWTRIRVQGRTIPGWEALHRLIVWLPEDATWQQARRQVPAPTTTWRPRVRLLTAWPCAPRNHRAKTHQDLVPMIPACIPVYRLTASPSASTPPTSPTIQVCSALLCSAWALLPYLFSLFPRSSGLSFCLSSTHHEICCNNNLMFSFLSVCLPVSFLFCSENETEILVVILLQFS